MTAISSVIVDGADVSKAALRAWLDAPDHAGKVNAGGGLSATGFAVAGSGVHLGLSGGVGVVQAVTAPSTYLQLLLEGSSLNFRVSGASKFNMDASAFFPTADNTLTLGGGSNRFSVVYAGTGAINTSDAREKQQITPVPDALLDAWAAVEWRRFKFNAAVETKGDENARWHFGAAAQQLRDAIDGALGEGAAIRLGLCCYDEWDAIAPVDAVAAVDEVRDGDDNVIVGGQPEIPARPGREAGDRWGLRYDECFAIEAAYQRRRMAAIEARLDALEA